MPRETRVAGRGSRLRRFLVHGAVLALLGGASAVCGRPGQTAGGSCPSATVSAYSLRGVTASGVPAGPGVVAVDPRLVPLGSTVAIDGVGTFTALDTGLFSGCHFDRWVPSYDEAMAWGVRTRGVQWW